VYNVAYMKIDKERLESIGAYIVQGMSEREACILSDVSPGELTALKVKNEQVRDYIEKKKIKFKYKHLKAINASDKNSQWLLEKLRPEEFGPRSKSQEPPTINIINQIMKEIHNDNEPLVVVSRSSRIDELNEAEENKHKAIEALN